MSDTTEFENDLLAFPGLDEAQLEALMRPLNAARVQHRSQGGANLSYLAAYDVRATLIRIFGFGGFSIEVISSNVEDISRRGADGVSGNYVVTCSAHVRLVIPSLGCVYSEVAASSQTGPSLGDVMDFALKTAVSDAMKRCAINLGSQMGLGLYDNGSLAEPVRVIFEPTQRTMLAGVRAKQQEGMSDNVRNMMARATTPQDAPQDSAK